MFELKYKITEADIKEINKKTMLFYFVLYMCVAVVGMAVGIVAIVLNPQKLMFVLGILLVVFGGILFLCAAMLLIAPKNFVVSVVKPSDDELTVKVDEGEIVVTSPNGNTVIPFVEVTNVKYKKDKLLVNVGKDIILLIKNAIESGQTLEELNRFIYARKLGVVNPVLARAESLEVGAENTAGNSAETDTDSAAANDGETPDNRQ
ncbi:MAG: hypothetical protein J1G01_06555 [Clostridiales bacterium]|nr:hypothetical protein [Clostridiales bacterium]